MWSPLQPCGARAKLSLELGGGGELFPTPANRRAGGGSQKEAFFPSFITQSMLHRVAERDGVAPALSSSATREWIRVEKGLISACRRRQGYVGGH